MVKKKLKKKKKRLKEEESRRCLDGQGDEPEGAEPPSKKCAADDTKMINKGAGMWA